MLELNLPAYEPHLRKQDGKLMIRCLVRKQYFVLTPEEWVRQHLINRLQKVRGVPLTQMRVERGIKYLGQTLRSDLIVYRDSAPWLIAECKAPHIGLSDDAVWQLTQYNQTLQVPYLLLTNGIRHYYFVYGKEGYGAAADVADYRSMD